jgi:hypothetical protein
VDRFHNMSDVGHIGIFRAGHKGRLLSYKSTTPLNVDSILLNERDTYHRRFTEREPSNNFQK